jgi:nucleoside-diphosphate-sugar epimerase
LEDGLNILVTGGAGYIGHALRRNLRAASHETGVADFKYGINADYRRLPGEAVSCYDAVIHLAGHSNVAACRDDPVGAFDNNLTGLVGLLGKLHHDQKFIYASSSSVYSQGIGGPGADFQNMYDFTKYASDAVVKLLRPENSWGMRFGTVNGASPNMRWDLMLNGMVRDALTKGVVTVVNPDTKRPILFMADLCAAVEKILRGDVPAGVHNLCSFNTTVGAAADAVATRTGAKVETQSGKTAYSFAMETAPWMPDQHPIGFVIDDIVKVVNR